VIPPRSEITLKKELLSYFVEPLAAADGLDQRREDFIDVRDAGGLIDEIC
jgi:hypothetical protein